VPDVVVELGRFTGLILDDPVQGRLDENVLDGDVEFEVVPQGVVSVSTSRGRDKDLGRTSAGNVSVSLRNQDRFFDPIVGGFRRYTLPRLPMRVKVDDAPIFAGFSDDWNYDYRPGLDSTASVSGTDGFSRFARQVNAGGSAVQETTGDRLERVLDQLTVDWIGPRDIDTGNSTLAAGDLGNDSALQYMLDIVEQSEQGLVFMGKDGTFTFRERLVGSVTDPVRFTDNLNSPKGPLGIPFVEAQIEYGTEDLVNQVIVTGPSGTVVREDLSSQVTLGITALQIDTQLATLAGQEGLADFVITRYAQPQYRIRSLTTNLLGLSDAQVVEVLGLDIGDQAEVTFRPQAIGPPTFATQNIIAVRQRIIGVSHNIGLDNHLVTFNFEELPFTFFVLDDDPFGRLDADGVLGF